MAVGSGGQMEKSIPSKESGRMAGFMAKWWKLTPTRIMRYTKPGTGGSMGGAFNIAMMAGE